MSRFPSPLCQHTGGWVYLFFLNIVCVFFRCLFGLKWFVLLFLMSRPALGPLCPSRRDLTFRKRRKKGRPQSQNAPILSAPYWKVTRVFLLQQGLLMVLC